MNRENLKQVVEAMLFSSDTPLTAKEIASFLDKDKKEVEEVLEDLKVDYKDKGINLVSIAGGFQFLTNPNVYRFVAEFHKRENRQSFSRAALETLAIIAYRQPITAQEIAALRGVQSVSQILRNLLEKNLIKIAGKKDVIGKPSLYKTTRVFLETFGLNSLEDLPDLEELGVE